LHLISRKFHNRPQIVAHCRLLTLMRSKRGLEILPPYPSPWFAKPFCCIVFTLRSDPWNAQGVFATTNDLLPLFTPLSQLVCFFRSHIGFNLSSPVFFAAPSLSSSLPSESDSSLSSPHLLPLYGALGIQDNEFCFFLVLLGGCCFARYFCFSDYTFFGSCFPPHILFSSFMTIG